MNLLLPVLVLSIAAITLGQDLQDCMESCKANCHASVLSRCLLIGGVVNNNLCTGSTTACENDCFKNRCLCETTCKAKCMDETCLSDCVVNECTSPLADTTQAPPVKSDTTVPFSDDLNPVNQNEEVAP
ncbi:hypothetical protein Bpfe_010357 [Biomphalaria pfeifferi]|uniref:Uncharacterized protein n=1 Tax=Biomphalaria pfeifferi TaxID=112525 RepID=A0AAD8FD96_BIOPF|nr:hypothetical protein Bpfe_010357 [Biomphalaria pfeifferi]